MSVLLNDVTVIILEATDSIFLYVNEKLHKSIYVNTASYNIITSVHSLYKIS